MFLSQREALALAFPGADRIERKSVVLDDAQAAAVEKLSGAPLESKLVTLHQGFRGDELLGYAMIDIHNVRTLPEAFMVVLTPEGRVATLRMLASTSPPSTSRRSASSRSSTRGRSSRRCASAARSTASPARRSRRAR